MDLWTIRLRRTGALAVEKSDDFPTARPFAHKLHSARAVLNKIQESQNQPPATDLSLFRPGSCPANRSHHTQLTHHEGCGRLVGELAHLKVHPFFLR